MWFAHKVKSQKKKWKITFKIISDEWLESKRGEVKKSTFSNYSFIIEKYLMYEFQESTLKLLEKVDFNEYVSELNQDLKPKTVKDIITILRAVLNYANDEYGCSININNIKAPKLCKDPIVILSKREKNKLEKYCLNEKTAKSIGIIVCLNTGLRIGEMCAIRWEDIDLDKRELYVRFTVQRVYDENLKKTKVIIDKPKTITSIRNIPISSKLYAILKDLKKGHKNNEFFLTGDIEKYVEPRGYQYDFKKILRKSKIKKSYNFHVLRHTFATHCVEVGMDVKSLSEILGHSSVEITLNRYVHSSYKMKKKYLEKL